jgi:hypothetical protein
MGCIAKDSLLKIDEVVNCLLIDMKLEAVQVGEANTVIAALISRFPQPFSDRVEFLFRTDATLSTSALNTINLDRSTHLYKSVKMSLNIPNAPNANLFKQGYQK